MPRSTSAAITRSRWNRGRPGRTGGGIAAAGAGIASAGIALSLASAPPGFAFVRRQR